MKSNRKTLSAAACCLLMLILLAGCAALSSMTAKEVPLEERVKGYMQAQMERKWDLAYAFFDSSSREAVARESYIGRARKTNFKAFSIEEIAVVPPGDQATVKVRVDIPYMGYEFKGISQKQSWVKEKGEWFVQSGLQSQRKPFIPQEKQK